MSRSAALLVSLLAIACAAQAAGFRFAIIGDRTGSATPGIYERIVEEINAIDPAIVVSVGDQIEGYTEDAATLQKEWDEYWAIAGRFEAPFYICPGNHDILNDTMESIWRLRTQREPNYSFDYEGVHFVILDTGRWETSEEWLAVPGYRAWLEEDLARHSGAPITIAVYHKPYWYNTLAEGKADPLHEIFRAGGVDAVFNGHFHVHGTDAYDGIPYTIVGSAGGAIGDDPERGDFFGWVHATIDGGRLNWSLMTPEGAQPFDRIRIADLKFLDQIDTEFVRLASFPYDEAHPEDRFVRMSILNPTPLPMAVDLRWDSVSNWVMTPTEQRLAIAPGAGADLAFQARCAGGFYPLPSIRFDYPYREGRRYAYSASLPAGRVQAVPRLAAAPAIDGAVEEEVWRSAGLASIFASPEGGPVAIDATVIHFGYDDANLYIAARCEHDDMASLVCKAANRDESVTRDDCVGFFFSADSAERTFHQIYVNSSGVIFDQRLTRVGPEEYEGDGPEWNGEMQVAARRLAHAWEVEAAIPFATLEAAPPGPGTIWRINFRRKEIGRGSSADWQVPIGFDPARFGYARFE